MLYMACGMDWRQPCHHAVCHTWHVAWTGGSPATMLHIIAEGGGGGEEEVDEGEGEGGEGEEEGGGERDLEEEAGGEVQAARADTAQMQQWAAYQRPHGEWDLDSVGEGKADTEIDTAPVRTSLRSHHARDDPACGKALGAPFSCG